MQYLPWNRVRYGGRQAVLALSVALAVLSCTVRQDQDLTPEERSDQIQERVEQRDILLRVAVGAALVLYAIWLVAIWALLGAFADLFGQVGFSDSSGDPGLIGR